MDLLQNNKPKTQNLSTRIEALMRVLLLCYVFTLPYSSAFAFSDTITLYLITAVLLFSLMCLKVLITGTFPPGFLGYDIFLMLLFFILVVFSYITNGIGVQKSFNHTFAFIVVYLLFYITIKFSFFQYSDKVKLLKDVLLVLTITTIISTVYVNIEFISENFFNIDMNDYVPRSNEEKMYYKAGILSLFHRARGFAGESGIYANMMVLFSPLVAYYLYFSKWCNWLWWIKALVIILIITSFLFVGSTSGFIVIPITTILTSIVYFKKIGNYIVTNALKSTMVFGIVVVIILIVDYFTSITTMVVLSVTGKFDTGSYDARKDKIDFFYDTFPNFSIANKLIGGGPAADIILGFTDRTPPSFYLQMIFELGLLGMFIFILFFGYLFLNAMDIKQSITMFLFASLIAGIIVFFVGGAFWEPWYWFIASFVLFSKKVYSTSAK